MKKKNPYNIDTCRKITDAEETIYKKLTWHNSLTSESYTNLEKALETLTEHYDLFYFFNMVKFMFLNKIYENEEDSSLIVTFIIESADLLKEIYDTNMNKNIYYDTDGIIGSHINRFPQEVKSILIKYSTFAHRFR